MENKNKSLIGLDVKRQQYKHKYKIPSLKSWSLVLIIFILCSTMVAIKYIENVAAKTQVKNEKLISIENKLDSMHKAAVEAGFWPAGVTWK
jgi:hypothetical protein